LLAKGAVLLALVIATGCGSATPADEPEPVTRHLVYEKATGIWIANPDGSRPRRLLKNGRAPAISPNGKWVAFFSECSESTWKCSLFITPASKAKPKLLASGFYGEFHWSPSSDRIVAARSHTDEGGLVEDLVSIDVSSGDETTLTQGALYGWSFSPDGSKTVFAVAQHPSGEGFSGDEVDLFITGQDGGEAKQITSDGHSGYPVWGPKSIAFAKLISCLPATSQEVMVGCTNNAWGRHEIWQLQADGSDRRPIVSPLPKRFQGQGYIGLIPLDWSADGRALLAGWLNEWGRIPMAVDPETGDVRQLAEDQASDGVALSRDGEMALVASVDNVGSYPNANAVLIAPFAGGRAHLVASGATSASWNR
jgi:Tol biopolymer transport system component